MLPIRALLFVGYIILGIFELVSYILASIIATEHSKKDKTEFSSILDRAIKKDEKTNI